MTNRFPILKNRLFFTLALNIAALLASLTVFCPFFEENDDSSIALIAEGAFSQRSPFLIYTNILYGKLLNFLYALLPSIRWHSVLQYIFAFLALCTITYLVSSHKSGRIISVILVLSSFYEVYVSLQYSKISALSALAGYFVLIAYVCHKLNDNTYGSVSGNIPCSVSLDIPGINSDDDQNAIPNDCLGAGHESKADNLKKSAEVHESKAANTKMQDKGGLSDPGILIYGSLLILFGFILREDGFLLASIFALIILFSVLVRFLSLPEGTFGISMHLDQSASTGTPLTLMPSAPNISDNNHNSVMNPFLRFVSACFKAFGPVLLVISALFFVNRSVYKSDPAWDSFITYNNIRTDLIDYRYDLLDYEAHGEELEALGISENDALLYLTWQFGDSRIFTVDLMREVLNAPFAGSRKIDITLLKSFAKHIYDDILLFNPAFLGLLSIIGLYILWFHIHKACKTEDYHQTEVNRKAQDHHQTKVYRLTGFLTLLLSAATLLLVLFYFEYSGRWSHRIVYAAFIMIIFTLGFELAELCGIHADSGLDKETYNSGDQVPEAVYIASLVPALLISVSVLAACLGNRFDRNSFLRTEPGFEAYLSHISENRDKLYIADTFTFQNSFKYDVFKPLREGELENFVTVGSWYVNSPVTKAVLGRFGYEDPFEALRSGDSQVILTDNMYAPEKLKYLNEHYEGGYSLKPLPEAYGYTEYRIENDVP